MKTKKENNNWNVNVRERTKGNASVVNRLFFICAVPHRASIFALFTDKRKEKNENCSSCARHTLSSLVGLSADELVCSTSRFWSCAVAALDDLKWAAAAHCVSLSQVNQVTGHACFTICKWHKMGRCESQIIESIFISSGSAYLIHAQRSDSRAFCMLDWQWWLPTRGGSLANRVCGEKYANCISIENILSDRQIGKNPN